MMSFNEKPTLGEFIQIFCNRSEKKDEHRMIHRGSVLRLDIYRSDDSEARKRIPYYFKEIYEWNDASFRTVWASCWDKAIITYCEGDISVVVCDSDEAYNQEYREAHEFYKNN